MSDVYQPIVVPFTEVRKHYWTWDLAEIIMRVVLIVMFVLLYLRLGTVLRGQNAGAVRGYKILAVQCDAAQSSGKVLAPSCTEPNVLQYRK